MNAAQNLAIATDRILFNIADQDMSNERIELVLGFTQDLEDHMADILGIATIESNGVASRMFSHVG